MVASAGKTICFKDNITPPYNSDLTFFADRFLGTQPDLSGSAGAALPGPYKLLTRKSNSRHIY